MRRRIFIIDDHRDFSLALGLVFEASGEMQVCGTAADIPDALQLLPGAGAELVTLDVNLPSGSGLDHLKELGVSAHSVPFLVISHEEPSRSAILARDAGAAGFLRKGAHPTKIVEVAKVVLAGGRYFPDAPGEG